MTTDLVIIVLGFLSLVVLVVLCAVWTGKCDDDRRFRQELREAQEDDQAFYDQYAQVKVEAPVVTCGQGVRSGDLRRACAGHPRIPRLRGAEFAHTRSEQ